MSLLSIPLIKEAGNGAVQWKKQSIIKDQSDREVDVTQNGGFLLGENRWEDPSRLIGYLKVKKKS